MANTRIPINKVDSEKETQRQINAWLREKRIPMSDKQILEQIAEAVEEYHEGRYRDGFTGRDGGERKRVAERALIDTVDGTYDAHRKAKE